MSASSIRRAESVLKITVQRDGTGDFTTISEAVLAVPYECEAEIEIGPGIYREKLVCEKQNITLRGPGPTRPASCGRRRQAAPPGRQADHTFRSYTAFFSGENLTVEDLTIENDAGPGHRWGRLWRPMWTAPGGVPPGEAAGQPGYPLLRPAAGKRAGERRLPRPRGWHPPGQCQYYHKCEIAGDIDFIFGGADALFEQCTLRTVDNHIPHSYVTAPSGKADGLGFVFWDCDFVSDCPAGSVYLGGRGAPRAKRRCWTAVWEPTLRRRLFPWNDRADTNLAAFAEAGSNGPGQFPVPAGSMP